jgi:hypothetical protein
MTPPKNRTGPITFLTRILAAFFSAVIFFVAYLLLEARVHGVAKMPLAWYQVVFMIVFLALLIPAVLSVAIFGREPRYWSILLARFGKPSASELRWRSRIPPWVPRVACVF